MPELGATEVADLVQASTLEAIEVYSLEAYRELDAPPSPQEIIPQYTIVIDLNPDAAEFRVRLETLVALPTGRISCGVLARYAYRGYVFRATSGTALTEFVNNVALMHILPYVRQAIADLAIRTFGRALLMPMLQRGQITFELDTDILQDLPS